MPITDESKVTYQELVEALEGCLAQACEHDGTLDSGHLGFYATGLRVLGRLGRVEIVDDDGSRRVIARPVLDVETRGG